MIGVPKRPRIYHITHVENLPSIITDGMLWSDTKMDKQGGPAMAIGMNSIKKRRMKELVVKCNPPDFVGDYVPFYFCPRSVMLYIIYRRNHEELTYRGGQGPIIHLESDLYEVVEWAKESNHRWAFSLSNAGAKYTEFWNQLDQLVKVDWAAVHSDDFSDSHVKEGKQAEFLLHTFFPWKLVRRIGVQTESIREKVVGALKGSAHRPVAERHMKWYF